MSKTQNSPEGISVGPIRTCIGCRGRFPVTALNRFSFTKSHGLTKEALTGRGAWVCSDSPKCDAKALRPELLTARLKHVITQNMVEKYLELLR